MNDLNRMSDRTIERTMRDNAKPEPREFRGAADVRAENARRHAAAMAKLGVKA